MIIGKTQNKKIIFGKNLIFSKNKMLKIIHKTNYSPSELVSRVFTKCPLVYNIHPRKILEETDEKIIETFYAICQFNVYLTCVETPILLAHIKFRDNFKKAIENPTEKTKQAADFYPTWYKMCCHLKFLGEKDLFHLFSSLSPKYEKNECEKFWQNCNPTFGSIPGVFSIIDKFVFPEAKIPNRRDLIRKTFFS